MDDSKIIDCLRSCLGFALIMHETGRQIECADLFKQKKTPRKAINFSLSERFPLPLQCYGLMRLEITSL